jgi:tetratricopeptide (TPR) repeat protein
VQSLYLGGNYGAAARELASEVEAETREGKNPSEEQLQLLANAYLQSKDTAGYGRTMEQLVALYPKRDYWLAVIDNVMRRSGFNERLQIDVFRLKIEAGTMQRADDYLDYAQLALIEGFPMEASKVIDKGYAAGVLGPGPEAARHKRLKDLAAKNLAEDKKAIADAEKHGTEGKDAKTVFNEGFNLVLNDKSAKGLAMMEQGLKTAGSAASGFRRPDHAKLQLGYAYHLAGQNTKAIDMFKTVQGTDGAAALARLWLIKLGRSG